MILVRAPGMFTTVQDLGREGYGALGVSPSGAADPVAIRIGNRLVGNPVHFAALEMTLLGGAFEFERPAWFALAGADCQASLGGLPVAPWKALKAAAGETLRMGGARTGARAYLAVRGGISVPLWLGSASTHILSGLGGLEGRPLRKGDRLQIGEASGDPDIRTMNPELLSRLAAPRTRLRVTRGLQADWFSGETMRTFCSGRFRVSEDSNRMGLRLQGPQLPPIEPRQLLTEGAPLGAIQVPAGGQPIILFVEQQTTGGYPKIANVISADLPSIGQLRPRDEIRFQLVSPEEAREAIIEHEALLESEELFLN